MKHLIIDTMNLAHRARSGFQLGPNPIMFNFFRGLRFIVELHKPDTVLLVFEGHPKHRHAIHASYKANRDVKPDDVQYAEKLQEGQKFYGMFQECVNVLQHIPFYRVQHDDFEADDIIALVVDDIVTFNEEAVVVSSDTDFIQLLAKPKVQLWNPVNKQFVTSPTEHDYVLWKSLKGDATDNIVGVPGVGPKTADRLLADPDRLTTFLGDTERFRVFQLNQSLVRFHALSEGQREGVKRYRGIANWGAVKQEFEKHQFNSITNDKSWAKFVATFENLK